MARSIENMKVGAGLKVDPGDLEFVSKLTVEECKELVEGAQQSLVGFLSVIVVAGREDLISPVCSKVNLFDIRQVNIYEFSPEEAGGFWYNVFRLKRPSIVKNLFRWWVANGKSLDEANKKRGKLIEIGICNASGQCLDVVWSTLDFFNVIPKLPIPSLEVNKFLLEDALENDGQLCRLPIEQLIPKLPTSYQNELRAKTIADLKAKGIYLEDQVPPVPEYTVFFSYARSDTAGETQALYQAAVARYGATKVFHDANTRFKLSELVSRVKTSAAVVVVLSENYPRRPFTMVELHYALRSCSKVHVVQVDSSPFNYEQVRQDIKEGKAFEYFSTDSWDLLREYDVTYEDVCANLTKIMDVVSTEYSLKHASKIQESMFEVIFYGI